MGRTGRGEPGPPRIALAANPPIHGLRMIARLKDSAPYWVTLAVTAYFFTVAQGISAPGTGDQLGPDFWPKTFLILMMLVCAIGIGRVLLGRRREPDDVFDRPTEGAPAAQLGGAPDEAPAKRYPLLLLGGVGLCLGYVVLFDTLGFFLDTLVFMLAFILLGRYRRIGVAVGTSLGGTLVFMYVFMKIVYVSLPIGSPPFSDVSIFLMKLMGIR